MTDQTKTPKPEEWDNSQSNQGPSGPGAPVFGGPARETPPPIPPPIPPDGSPPRRPQPAAEEPPVCEAEFPKGFWKSADYLLHHPNEVLESLHRDKGLVEMSKTLLVITLGMAVIYGAVMGATNLLQGSTMALHEKMLMIVITAIKVPALFLLTLFIVLWPIYVSNAFMGARHSFRVVVAEMLAAMAVTSTTLASMATVIFFFALTSETYDFIKLLHVLFFAYAGVVGLTSLIQYVRELGYRARRATPRFLFFIWLLLYAFVGTQMAWVMRPFVGSPGEKFQVFRPRQGNFYESVFKSLGKVLEEKPEKK